jgi:hypothetical protein
MTLRTFIDKNGNTWEWEETPELLEAIRKLHEIKNDTETKTVG